MADHTPLTGQQLTQLDAIAARVADDPFYVSDCEGSLQVWRENALTHVRRDENGEIEMYSFPSSYRVTDQVIEINLNTWDPGEDETDDKQRQDIYDLVESREAVPALVDEIRRLRSDRDRYRTAWRLARTRALSTGGAADRYAARARAGQAALQDMFVALLATQMERDEAQAHVAALRTVLATPAEETHVVADDSDDPEHVDDCPGCEAFTLTGHRAAAAAVAGDSGTGQ